MHDNPPFAAWVAFLRAELDRLVPALTPAARDCCVRFFAEATGLERAFFDAAHATGLHRNAVPARLSSGANGRSQPTAASRRMRQAVQAGAGSPSPRARCAAPGPPAIPAAIVMAVTGAGPRITRTTMSLTSCDRGESVRRAIPPFCATFGFIGTRQCGVQIRPICRCLTSARCMWALLLALAVAH